MGMEKRSRMRPIEELPEGELAALFYMIEDGPSEGHTIVVIGDWVTVNKKKKWFVLHRQLIDKFGCIGKEPIGWYPLPKN